MNNKIILFVILLVIILGITGFLIYAKINLGWFKSLGGTSNPTSVSGTWVVDTKSNCSATACGTSGTTTSTFKCHDNNNAIVDDSKCLGTKPNSVDVCNAPSCGMWVTDNCPKCFADTCGSGKGYQQTRIVSCVDRNDNTKVLGDDKCYINEKPSIVNNCLDQKPCLWKAGGWYATGGNPPTQDNFVSCDNTNNNCSKV